MIAFATFLGQEVVWGDLGVVALLVLLEGVLSIDNALVLGLLAKRLPKSQQQRALTYGLVGAFVFRILAIGTATFLLRWSWVKLLGGGYLAYVAIKHLWFERSDEPDPKIIIGPTGEPELVDVSTGAPLTAAQEEIEVEERVPVPLPDMSAAERGQGAKFWPTVLVIELTDIAFAVDSILAAIALVGPPPRGHAHDAIHPKLWVIITGGILGVILMRFAAVVFIKLLERFPNFESAAYLLVLTIGVKLLVDWGFNPTATEANPHPPHRVDFHDFHRPEFWVFWIAMLLCFATGFLPKRKEAPQG